jgi:ATP-binding cassette subfamily B protein
MTVDERARSGGGGAEASAWRVVAWSLRLTWATSPRTLGWVTLLSASAALMPPATLWLVWRLVDTIGATGASGLGGVGSLWLITLLALVTAAQQVTSTALEGARDLFGYRVAASAQRTLLEHASRVPFDRFDDHAWHDRFQRASDDVSWRPFQVTESLLQLAGTAAGLAGMAGLLALLDPWLIVFALVSGAPLVVLHRANARALYAAWRDVTEIDRGREYAKDVLTRPELAKDVRAYDLSGTFVERHARLSDRLIGRMRCVHRGNLRRSLAAAGCNAAGLALAYYLLGRGAVASRLSPGDLFLLFSAFSSVSLNVVALFSQLVDVEEHGAYLTDYFVTLAEPVEDVEHDPSAGAPLDLSKGLAFEHVDFTYPGGEQALRDISFHVGGGELVAVVGANGAGKSTLVKLLLRLVEPDAGRIVLGGRPLAEIGIRRLRERFAVLFQEYGRYEMTVGEAVALGRVQVPADDRRIRRALKESGSAGYVDQLPLGPASPVGRLFRGARDLSGGQWQRLALARAIYRDAAIQVLDEPTAALDPAAEWELLQRLRRRPPSCLTILITHRMGSAAQADRIVVIDHGRVVEVGTHAELLARAGLYARMYEQQARSFITAANGHGHAAAAVGVRRVEHEG